MFTNAVKYTSAEAEAKRVGHIMGIAGGAQVKRAQYLQTFVAQTEINFHPVTIKYIQEKLRQYQPKSNQAEWSEIKEMFEATTIDVHNITSSNSQQRPLVRAQVIQQQIRKYREGNPVHICTGWDGHHIGVTLHNGYLIVTNRGLDGIPGEGTIIYKLNEPIANSDLEILQKSMTHGGTTSQTILATLARMQDGKIASFPQHGQKKGTCSYVNKLASAEGILCLLALEKKGTLNDANIRAYTANKENRAAYKDFTRANRKSEVDRVISLISQATVDRNEEQLAVMVNIAFSIVKKYERPTTNTQKHEEEILHSLALLKAIEPHQAKLSHNNQAQYPRLMQKHRAQSQLPLPPSAIPGFAIIKSQIIKKTEADLFPQDPLQAFRMPRWSMPLNQQLRAAQNSADINQAFNTSLKLYPQDTRLQKLADYARVTTAIPEATPIIPTPVTPPIPSTPMPPSMSDFAIVKPQIIKNIETGLFPQDPLQAFRMPRWYMLLSQQLRAAQNSNDFKQALATSDIPDNVLNSCFEQAIKEASNIPQMADIIDMYPKTKITSVTGNEYSPQQLASQLRDDTTLKPLNVTSALGIRNKFIELNPPKPHARELLAKNLLKQYLQQKNVGLDKKQENIDAEPIHKKKRI